MKLLPGCVCVVLLAVACAGSGISEGDGLLHDGSPELLDRSRADIQPHDGPGQDSTGDTVADVPGGTREATGSETAVDLSAESNSEGPEEAVTDAPADWPEDVVAAGPDVVVAVVGPEGASVSIPGGGSLTVPAGALPADIEITVGPTEALLDPDYLPAGAFHSFAPVGLVFAKPVTVVLPYDAALQGSQEAAVVMVWTDENGHFEPLPGTVDTQNNVVVAEVAHFSDGGPVIPAQEPICCITLDGNDQPESAVKQEEQCAVAGGLVAGDASECEDIVCCASSASEISFAGFIPKSVCAQGYVQTDTWSCDPVCCIDYDDAGASTAILTSLWACTMGGNPDQYGPALCSQTACCEGMWNGDSFMGVLPKSWCDFTEWYLAPAECEEVCCVGTWAGVPVVTDKYACEKSYSGTVAGPPQDCEGYVCCAFDVFGLTVTKLVQELYCEPGGVPVDVQNCAQ